MHTNIYAAKYAYHLAMNNALVPCFEACMSRYPKAIIFIAHYVITATVRYLIVAFVLTGKF